MYIRKLVRKYLSHLAILDFLGKNGPFKFVMTNYFNIFYCLFKFCFEIWVKKMTQKLCKTGKSTHTKLTCRHFAVNNNDHNWKIQRKKLKKIVWRKTLIFRIKTKCRLSYSQKLVTCFLTNNFSCKT